MTVVLLRVAVADAADAANPDPGVAAFRRPDESLQALPVVTHGGSAVVQTDALGGDPATVFSLDVQNIGDKPIEVVATVLGISEIDPSVPNLRRMVPRAPAAAVSQAVAIAGAALAAVRVSVALEAPGIYEVETELVDRRRAFAPTLVRTMIYRRRSWLAAALWVALGAVIAFGARLYIDGGAARLKLRRRIALLVQQIRAARERATSDAVTAAARALELDVDDRRRYVRWGGTVEDVRCAIDRAELRLALLCDIIDAAAQLERLDPARQPAIRKVLDDALAVVRVDPGDEASIKAKRNEVSQLGLLGIWRDQLAADLAMIGDQIAMCLPAALPSFGASLRALGGELAQARDDLARDRLDAAFARLDQLRPQLLAILADQLASLIIAALPGVEPARWKSATDAISASLTEARDAALPWPARWSAFKTAQDSYITTAVTGLVAIARQQAASDAQHAARMTEIAGELEAAMKDPATAAAIYDARRREIELAERAVTRGVVADAVAASAKMWLPLALGSTAAKPEVAAAREVVMLDREVAWTGAMVNVAILAIAVASGIKALWLDDLAWGSHGAALTAFLWGAGVQAAGNAFTGLAALRTRLGAA